MNRILKITLVILGLGTLAIVTAIAAGLYMMAIEDQYGDNEDFYYKSKQGDIVVNRDTREFRILEKSWTRIYTIEKTDTVDLWGWLDKDRVEIYRLTNDDLNVTGMSYSELEQLIDDKELELIIQK